jgi:hypothetical protein
MDASQVLDVFNQDPTGILAKIISSGSRGSVILVNGISCTAVRNNLRGGAIVYAPDQVFELKWDLAHATWSALTR